MKISTIVIVGFMLVTSPVTFAAPNSIVGTWETDEMSSQFGKSKITYVFDSKGGFSVVMVFMQAEIPTFSASGTYELTPDKIIMKNGSRIITDSYYFDGPILVIDEGGPENIFRLKKVVNELKDY